MSPLFPESLHLTRNLIIFPFFWISRIFYPLKCAFFLVVAQEKRFFRRATVKPEPQENAA